MVAFSKNGLDLFPKGTWTNLIVRTTPWSFHRKRWTSWSSLCTPTCRKALLISAVSATFHRRNRTKMAARFGSMLGQVSRQSFNDTPLGPAEEASKTGRTLVVRLLLFTTGRCGRWKTGEADTISASGTTSTIPDANMSCTHLWYSSAKDGVFSILRVILSKRHLAWTSLPCNLSLKPGFQGRPAW